MASRGYHGRQWSEFYEPIRRLLVTEETPGTCQTSCSTVALWRGLGTAPRRSVLLVTCSSLAQRFAHRLLQ
jgi:hypothetical protein